MVHFGNQFGSSSSTTTWSRNNFKACTQEYKKKNGHTNLHMLREVQHKHLSTDTQIRQTLGDTHTQVSSIPKKEYSTDNRLSTEMSLGKH